MLRYNGFQDTPFLPPQLLEGLDAFVYTPIAYLNAHLPENIRLGHVAEIFYMNNLKSFKRILYSNIQLIDDSVTLGELDFILVVEHQTWHIEAAYKFYLLDPTENGGEINQWIGPNRKDSLAQKIHRIKNHQFKIIEKNTSKTILKEKYSIDKIDKQAVLFKAQLFVPYNYNTEDKQVEVAGFYMNIEQLNLFEKDKFFIPSKMDWFCIPHSDVQWKGHESILPKIKHELASNFSPMIWIKTKKGELHKAFIVWW